MATFKTRARTVDMLGRQQIAGIPSAINELFKNAHDAYADRVEVDYYRSDKLFVLRDDGIGMTEEEFLTRWLTLGTESKVGVTGKGMPPPYRPPDKPERPLTGEKGIGRLAIAVLGPQVLILTRAKRDDQLHDLVVAYIHWGIFEIPGLNLEDIEIPIRTFPEGTPPNANVIREMTEAFRSNLNGYEETETGIEVAEGLDAFEPDPAEIAAFLPSGPDLRDGGTGTWFIIRPANEMLERDIDGTDYIDKASPIDKALLGFTQTMTPNHPDPVIQPAFRDHVSDILSNDIITEDRFFTPYEMENADHRIWGEFDEYGQFKGSVSVYGTIFEEHIVNWREGDGNKTRCGPFSIDFSSIPGKFEHTTLPNDEHARITAKMDLFGGLYIYRDNIRVLPYGDTEFDWLDIELRRSKSASFYFFAHRRMFGLVTISRSLNPHLQEKAGREGFRENLGYRQFRSILKHFFVQLAADFFRDESKETHFKVIRDDLERQDKARKRREKQVSGKREKLKSNLEAFFSDYDAGTPQQEVLSAIDFVTDSLHRITGSDDPAYVAKELLNLESEARERLSELREKYTVPKPRGVGLRPKLDREYGHYREARQVLEDKVFSDFEDLIEKEISAQAAAAAVDLDRRERIHRALDEIESSAKKTAKSEEDSTDRQVSELAGDVRKVARESVLNIDRTIRAVWDRFARTDVSSLQEEEAVRLRRELEEAIRETRDKEMDFLQYIRDQLDRINLDPNEFGSLDELEAVEQKAIALEERADLDLQMTQLGMALGVVQHEFNMSVKTLRDSVRGLKAWADLNDDLKGLYNDFRNSFEHLDGFLSLFEPLDRRLYRKKTTLEGNEIESFLKNLFEERCARHRVEIKATPAFRKLKVNTIPSSVLPVFVNLADNAIFWLSDRPDPRVIKLDAEGESYLISDNGPGIPERDREAVFEQGFTRKPGGRGLGLFISRETLKRIGFVLELFDSSDSGTTFRIGPEKDA